LKTRATRGEDTSFGAIVVVDARRQELKLIGEPRNRVDVAA
jgi:hypothetical protein